MKEGKMLFAQMMELVPWKTFSRIAERHKGDADARTLGCIDLFLVWAFARRYFVLNLSTGLFGRREERGFMCLLAQPHAARIAHCH
jgi:hypothetical protein